LSKSWALVGIFLSLAAVFALVALPKSVEAVASSQLSYRTDTVVHGSTLDTTGDVVSINLGTTKRDVLVVWNPVISSSQYAHVQIALSVNGGPCERWAYGPGTAWLTRQELPSGGWTSAFHSLSFQFVVRKANLQTGTNSFQPCAASESPIHATVLINERTLSVQKSN